MRILLAWAALAHAKEMVSNHMGDIQDSLDNFVEKFANKLVVKMVERALGASLLRGADLDSTSLRILGHVSKPGHTSLRSPLPLRASSWLSLQPRVRGKVAQVATAPGPVAVEDTATIRSQILQIAALTDRGQRLNTFIAPTYQEKRGEMNALVERLVAKARDAGKVLSEAELAGDWELVYSDVELFRSSPFFLAIEEALNGSPGIPALGRWLGATDPKRKAELFFKLHQLQVMSWGVSTVGRIGQTLNFEAGLLESTFDTTLFGLTVIPILGWFKLLPTFGGRVVTEANGLKLGENGTLCMELQRTQVKTAPGIPRVPLVDGLLMDRWYPVNGVWKFLPWNGGPFDGRAPTCSVKVEYVDEQMRISRDSGGGLFVYMRPTSPVGT